ncbi:MAG: MotA/TolQ/ExbB proton channel family protein [Acidobacteriota bacterium]
MVIEHFSTIVVSSAHSLLALQEPAAGSFDWQIVSMIQHSGLVAKFVLLVLLFFSVVSWAIFVSRYMLFARARKEGVSFLRVFRKSRKFSDVTSVCDKYPNTPLVAIFQAGFGELNYQIQTSQSNPGLGRGAGDTAELSKDGRMVLKNLESINRAMLRAEGNEVSRLEKLLGFLATTGSVTPFVGLFGTVYGIMDSFQMIGVQGSANLATVAPGISEALITTAAGLFTAIPAVIAYNYFLNLIKNLSAEMDDFSMEFLSIIEKNFT